jgi:chemotaxis protein methyltransferase WspC
MFVGPGEANLMLGAAFVSAHVPRAFAFRKTPPAAATPRNVAARHRTAPLAQPAPPPRRAFTQTRAGAASNAPALALKRPDFTEIRHMADAGRLADAAAACEEHLRKEEPSARAWSLLGLLRDAAGEQDTAAACYRKALYLDPTDRETLEHLSLLLQRQGDVSGAKRASARALRLERKAGR